MKYGNTPEKYSLNKYVCERCERQAPVMSGYQVLELLFRLPGPSADPRHDEFDRHLTLCPNCSVGLTEWLAAPNPRKGGADLKT